MNLAHSFSLLSLLDTLQSEIPGGGVLFQEAIWNPPPPANFRQKILPEIIGRRFYRELKPRFDPAFSHFTLFWLNFPRRWLASHCYRAAAGKIPNQNLGQQT